MGLLWQNLQLYRNYLTVPLFFGNIFAIKSCFMFCKMSEIRLIDDAAVHTIT